MSVVTKRSPISATAELLFNVVKINDDEKLMMMMMIFVRPIHYDTIRYDILRCAEKLTGSQLIYCTEL